MTKKSLYPKTKRVSNERSMIVATEKLDGSNIGFFKLNDELLIGTRNNVIQLCEIEKVKKILCKGMYEWLIDNGELLKDSLHEGSGIFGEWIAMGKLKYPDLDKRMYMFAKANIDEDLNITNINYTREFFIYPFIDQLVPEFIGYVPHASDFIHYPTIGQLDTLYESYTERVGRHVEGFIVNDGYSIRKYVRMKNGSLEAHRT